MTGAWENSTTYEHNEAVEILRKRISTISSRSVHAIYIANKVNMMRCYSIHSLTPLNDRNHILWKRRRTDKQQLSKRKPVWIGCAHECSTNSEFDNRQSKIIYKFVVSFDSMRKPFAASIRAWILNLNEKINWIRFHKIKFSRRRMVEIKDDDAIVPATQSSSTE